MNSEQQKYVGYFKYKGKLVEEGCFDARKAADALVGIDTVLRYFIYQEDPSLREVDFEIPVKIQKGSWVTFISDLDWVAIGKVLGTVYASAALKKMADNDFKDVGFKTIMSNSVGAVCWVVKLACHIGSTKKKEFKPTAFVNNNEDVVITNSKGETLQIPIKYLEAYKNCPDSLFSKIAEHIEEERELEISLNDSKQDKANITYANKNIFYIEEEDEEEEIILPELEHGKYVEIEGHVNRGNEKTNTIGFEYSNHSLTCTPRNGSVVSYKINIFDNCVMKGVVDRIDNDGNYIHKRPRIIFTELTKIESRAVQGSLFTDEHFK